GSSALVEAFIFPGQPRYGCPGVAVWLIRAQEPVSRPLPARGGRQPTSPVHVARVEGEIPVLLTADIDPIPSPCIPVLGFHHCVVVTDPAIARVLGVVPMVTLPSSGRPTHPAGADRHLASGNCLFELLHQSTRQGITTVEKVALGVRQR